MIFSRYLTKEIFKSQIAILFILLLIFFCQQLVRVLSSAVSGKIPTDLVVHLLGLGMPTMAQLMLPLSLFVALLLTLGRFYAESEITVMRACGVGQGVLVKVALFLSVFTTALATYNAFWVNPWAMSKQSELLAEAETNPRFSALSAGQFMSTGGYVLYIDNITGNSINDIFVFQPTQKKKNRPSVVTAESGQLTGLPNGDQVLMLNNSTRFEGTPQTVDFKVSHFEKYSAYLGYKNVDSTDNQLEKAGFSELLKDKSTYAQAELQWRLALILAVPLMALLAVPMSSVNPRQGRFAKLLPALLLYLIYFLLQSALKSAGASGRVNAMLLMPLVSVGFFVLATILSSWDTRWFVALRHRLSIKR
ncbi:LPS export ABC transporter permease LptF [Pasteurella skyensis]|uniref:Lipopolysaccharide export system permease protein LptF n=1 Tax=Phocoenobacter skyensis TaxID=97481 RepID=A0AAJ6P0A8_9PAST|nr:LPS export ABC transporter permease LptF [Pasteurella skyensis]MDP8162494.1 LPS export ABC transporter permease LptF [Pasteurella skyensis]MDP8170790.1 LPS export ABC transporter permease LptF [Pasteurella skyensis]MDP8172459.1 LPS export ABC transporter permease LptF [Pasteurella skyensis]MDP8174892.1 LPS export ABC transporter permease LptF [Pasteurella skyensis]MDP8177484.1 LPS export ABC transporter permease LptF [Pasteurella skyensis]